MNIFERRITKPVRAVALGLGLSLSAIMPVHAADQALIDAAKAEGTVVWYTTLLANYLARPMKDAFEAKYPGITVEMVNGYAGDLYQKLTAEFESGAFRADVTEGQSVAAEFIRKGYTEPYVPESAKDYSSEYIGPDGTYLRVLSYYMGIAVNSDLVKPEDYPKTQEDLLKPMWKDRMVLAGGPLGGGPAYIGVTLELLGEEKGMDFLEKLSEQNVVSLPANQRVVLDSVISGEHLLGIGMFNHHIPLSKAKGAPVEFLAVEPIQSYGQNAVLLKGPHRNAGKLFLDFMLSEEGQNIVKKAGYIPTHPNVDATVPELKPEVGGFKAINTSPEWAKDNRDKLVGIYTKLFVKN